MPKVKIEKVVTFSSEDPAFPASNILDSDPAKKWKCALPGEKMATIVLQLDKAVCITSIDLGNEHSAFVEILVNRSSNDSDDYKPFLTMSSFMSAIEARQSQNVNKVRMFNTKDFTKPECEEKWDRIKMICSQPFNKHVTYGLSFITIHSSEHVDNSSVKKNIGKFTLRPESPDFSVGSLLNRHKKTADNATLKGAAAIREASNNPITSNYKSPIQQKTPKRNIDCDSEANTSSRNRNELLYSEEDDAPNAKIDKLIEKKRKEDEDKKQLEIKRKKEADIKREEEKRKTGDYKDRKKTPQKRKSDDESEGGSPRKKIKTKDVKDAATTLVSPKRRHDADTPSRDSKKMKPNTIRKPFEKLLEDVVFVISGIQNPERANLRAAALSMGAKYKADWDPTCTHLICAFMNTPKFNQVKGRGKIVTKHWITECSSQRKKIPWRRFALDRNDKKVEESEEEVLEEIDNNEEESNLDNSFDTDEEIERIQNNIKNGVNPGASTSKMGDNDSRNGLNLKDEDDLINDLPVLPDYFKDKRFYLDATLRDLKKQINQYIVAYQGTVLDEINDNEEGAQIIVIASSEKTENPREKPRAKSNVTTVSPVWIWECHNKKQLVPMTEFALD